MLKCENSMELIALGHEFLYNGDLEGAEKCYLKALVNNENLAIGHFNLGWIKQLKGDILAAIFCYRKALELNNSLRSALVTLATLLSKLKMTDEAIQTWRALIIKYPDDRKLLHQVIGNELRADNIESASVYSEEYSAHHRGSKWHAYSKINNIPAPEKLFPIPKLSIRKLKHDILQFKYLHKNGILESDIADIIEKYEHVYEGLLAKGVNGRMDMDSEQSQVIGEIYNRLVYVRPTPRLNQALSDLWNGAEIEKEYFGHPLGLAVIDNFLTKDALQSMRQFCLQSTVWYETRYSHGMLGATFRDGLNCPLLVQIAEEIRSAFPHVIGLKHKVQQIWGFKNENFQPEIRPHADCAAVNVNFWLTPENAVIDGNSSGMIIYDKEAPQDWDFDTIHKDGDRIDAFLKENNAQTLYIPYKANRAVMFNSDLFHKTATIRFEDGYENRRMNITLLFGKREDTFIEPV